MPLLLLLPLLQCVCTCLGVTVSMAGFLAGEAALCQTSDLSDSAVDCAVRTGELKQQLANNHHSSHGTGSTRDNRASLTVTAGAGVTRVLLPMAA